MTGDFKSLLRSNLLALAMKAYKEMNARSMPDDPYLQLLADRLAGVVTGKTKRLIVNLPPRHFKTWIGSICLSAWILGRDPSAKILIVTYGQELADKIAHTIRGIMRSEWYRELFKKTRLAKSRSKLVDFVTTAGGGVRSVSIEGGVTGHGADFIIIDDPIEPAQGKSRHLASPPANQCPSPLEQHSREIPRAHQRAIGPHAE